MDTFASVIDTLGGGAVVGKAIGEEAGTVRQWKRRRIPADKWPAIVRLARERGCQDVTYELLEQLDVAAQASQPPAPAQAA